MSLSLGSITRSVPPLRPCGRPIVSKPPTSGSDGGSARPGAMPRNASARTLSSRRHANPPSSPRDGPARSPPSPCRHRRRYRHWRGPLPPSGRGGWRGRPRAPRRSMLGYRGGRRCGRASPPVPPPRSAPAHDRDAVGNVLDHREVVADEEIGEAECLPEVAEQVQDLRLHRDVERRGRLVEDQQVGLQRRGRGRWRCAGAGRRRRRAESGRARHAAGQRDRSARARARRGRGCRRCGGWRTARSASRGSSCAGSAPNRGPGTRTAPRAGRALRSRGRARTRGAAPRRDRT